MEGLKELAAEGLSFDKIAKEPEIAWKNYESKDYSIQESYGSIRIAQ